MSPSSPSVRVASTGNSPEIDDRVPIERAQTAGANPKVVLSLGPDSRKAGLPMPDLRPGDLLRTFVELEVTTDAFKQTHPGRIGARAYDFPPKLDARLLLRGRRRGHRARAEQGRPARALERCLQARGTEEGRAALRPRAADHRRRPPRLHDEDHHPDVACRGSEASRARRGGERISSWKGHLSKPNGFNCLEGEGPQRSEKFGVLPVRQPAGQPVYVNLVAVSSAPFEDPTETGDDLPVERGSFLKVLRYPAELDG